MTARLLEKPLRAFRIGDPAGQHPIYSGKGSALVEGRWHEKGQDVIYASKNYSTSMLEKLVHFNGILPGNQHFIEILMPNGMPYEVATKDTVRGWDVPDSPSARTFGSRWFRERRSAILIVPSYVARVECNVLINPHHPASHSISVGLEQPVWWDVRLFPAAPASLRNA